MSFKNLVSVFALAVLTAMGSHVNASNVNLNSARDVAGSNTTANKRLILNILCIVFHLRKKLFFLGNQKMMVTHGSCCGRPEARLRHALEG